MFKTDNASELGAVPSSPVQHQYQAFLDNPQTLVDPLGLQATQPAATHGSATFGTGTLSWDLQFGTTDKTADLQTSIKFTPTKGQCPCKNIAFVQVIHVNTFDGATHYGPK